MYYRNKNKTKINVYAVELNVEKQNVNCLKIGQKLYLIFFLLKKKPLFH